MSLKSVVGICLGVLLCSCGGGGGGESPATSQPVVTLVEPVAAYEPGRAVSLAVDLASLAGATATFDGAPLVIHTSAGTVSFLVPDVAAGRHTVHISAGGATHVVSLATVAAPAIADPQAYLTSQLATVKAGLQADIAAAADAAEAALLQSMLDQIVANEGSLAALDASGRAALARVVQANAAARIEAQYDAYLASGYTAAAASPVAAALFGYEFPNLSECGSNTIKVIKWGGATVVFGAAFAVSKTPVDFAFVGLPSLYGFYKSAKILKNEAFPAAYEHCITNVVVKVANDVLEESAPVGAAVITPEQDTLKFLHKMSSRKAISFKGRMDDSVPDFAFTLAQTTGRLITSGRSLLAFFNIELEAGFEDDFYDFQRESEKGADAADLEITAISNEDIEGTLEGAGEGVKLTFRFTGELPSAPVAFTFKLRDKAGSTQVGPYTAELSPLACHDFDTPGEVVGGTPFDTYVTSCHGTTGTGAELSTASTSDRYSRAVGNAGHSRFEYIDVATTPASYEGRNYSEETGGVEQRYSAQVSVSGQTLAQMQALTPGTTLSEVRSYMFDTQSGALLYFRTVEVLLSISEAGYTRRQYVYSCDMNNSSTTSVALASTASFDAAMAPVGEPTNVTSQSFPNSNVYCGSPATVQALYYVDKTTGSAAYERANAAPN